MSVHPMEGRYGRKEVREIFEGERRLQRMLDVEAALSRAHAAAGNIPKKDAEAISRKASTRFVKLERVKEIEKQINHDVMALVKALTEQCGSAGSFIHLGATSNDITDTALALQLRDYIAFLESDLRDLQHVLVTQARRHKRTVCVGRTHGQHAVPTTYGLKFAIWAGEVARHRRRLAELKPRILVGQMTGAVGTQAAFGKHARRIQEHVMSDLGLESVDVSNQVIQRDRHAEFMLYLALVAESLNKFATEIRNLQRTEIAEVSEGFGKKQVGSSTMPHKRNPILAERICGLSRVIKADAFASLENVPLWHERDLTNSSCERVIIPEACILADYILQLSISLLRDLAFNTENIKRNLGLSGGRIMAEALMIKLVEHGIGRQEAHELVRKAAMDSVNRKVPFRDLLVKTKKIARVLTDKEIDEALDPANYVGTAAEQVDELIKSVGR